ncbi:MAG: response regulator transcription factor [Gammaproteobacteria bacterium]
MRILVIEDNRDIAENIADFLEPRGHTLDFAYDGITGMHLAVTGSYDVIVLDLMLPAMDGLTLCRKLRDEGRNDTPVLMLTARDQLADKLAGFRAGSDDYLVKPFSLEELELRLTALHRRGTGRPSGRVLRVADLEFDPDTLVARRAGRTLDLNPTMRRLLQVLMENSHRVVRRDELEHALWGDDPPEGDVLRTHIHALRTVVDRPFPAALIHTVHGAGYRLSETGGR